MREGVGNAPIVHGSATLVGTTVATTMRVLAHNLLRCHTASCKGDPEGYPLRIVATSVEILKDVEANKATPQGATAADQGDGMESAPDGHEREHDEEDSESETDEEDKVDVSSGNVFLRAMMHRLEWSGLVSAAKDVRGPHDALASSTVNRGMVSVRCRLPCATW